MLMSRLPETMTKRDGPIGCEVIASVHGKDRGEPEITWSALLGIRSFLDRSFSASATGFNSLCGPTRIGAEARLHVRP